MIILLRWLWLTRIAEHERQHELDQSQCRIYPEDDTVRYCLRLWIRFHQGLDEPAADDGPAGCAGRAQEGVPGKYVTTDGCGSQLGEGRFFDGAEGTNLVPAVSPFSIYCVSLQTRIPRYSFSRSQAHLDGKLLSMHSPWTDDAQYTRQNQNPIIVHQCEDYPASTHQHRPSRQDPPPPQSIRHERQEETDDHIPQQGQGHEEADAGIRGAQAGEVEGED